MRTIFITRVRIDPITSVRLFRGFGGETSTRLVADLGSGPDVFPEPQLIALIEAGVAVSLLFERVHTQKSLLPARSGLAVGRPLIVIDGVIHDGAPELEVRGLASLPRY